MPNGATEARPPLCRQCALCAAARGPCALIRRLSCSFFSVAREIRNIELLKLRFGEEQLGVCGVMLKDFADSKRTHANFREVAAGAPLPEAVDGRSYEDLHVFVLSRLFWPSLKEDTFALPAVRTAHREACRAKERSGSGSGPGVCGCASRSRPVQQKELANFFEEYTEAFKKLKPARTLEVRLDTRDADRVLRRAPAPVSPPRLPLTQLRPALGTVDLTVELASGPVRASAYHDASL